jgi:hypothetical protein
MAVLGAANELIATELLHGSPDSLDALAPDIVYLITLPPDGDPFARARRAAARRKKARRTEVKIRVSVWGDSHRSP